MDIDAQQYLLPPSVFLVMVTVGIELQIADFARLVRAPRVAVLGTLIHTLTFPVIAAALVSGALLLELNWSEAMVIGILLIAACPSGGFSNVLVLIARADLPLSVVLTAVSSLLAFATVPLLFKMFGVLVPDLGGSIDLPVGATLGQLLVLIVIPVALGMGLRRLSPDRIGANTTRLQNGAQAIFYVVAVILVIQNWTVMADGITEALPWSVGLCAITLSVGFGAARIAGLDASQCATIALEGSVRNLAVAFVVAANVLDRVDVATLPLVYFFAVLLIGMGFSFIWRGRMSAVSA